MSQSVPFARLAINAIQPFTLFTQKALYSHAVWYSNMTTFFIFFPKCFSHHNSLRRCMNTSHEKHALFALMPSIYIYAAIWPCEHTMGLSVLLTMRGLLFLACLAAAYEHEDCYQCAYNPADVVVEQVRVSHTVFDEVKVPRTVYHGGKVPRVEYHGISVCTSTLKCCGNSIDFRGKWCMIKTNELDIINGRKIWPTVLPD